MKTQTATTLPAEEEYDYYPSEYITGRPAAYDLSGLDLRCIFEELRKMVDADSRGDIDGERYELDFKVYRIEAVHHFRTHEVPGGYTFCGLWEPYVEIDDDRLEVCRVYDEEGTEYPEIVARLNDYSAKRQG